MVGHINIYKFYLDVQNDGGSDADRQLYEKRDYAERADQRNGDGYFVG
jgi:hypothetical protein